MALLFSCRSQNLIKFSVLRRTYSDVKSSQLKTGLVIGVYTEEAKDQLVLTSAADHYNNVTGGKLLEHLKLVAPDLKNGNTRILYNLDPQYLAVSVVGLSKKNQGYDELEEVDQDRETARCSAAAGCKALQSIGITDVAVDSFQYPEAAAEGAILSTWMFQDYKNEEKRKKFPTVTPYEKSVENDWEKGSIKAASQNIARRLTDTPANLMTPTIFADNALKILKNEGVEVVPRDKKWAEEMKMGSFLSVARGSEEPPVFLELTYNGGSKNENPVVLVGKGVTFDTGGISIKPSGAMDEMRGDMGGAACVFSTLHGIARLKYPINVKGLIPLCENMPSGTATKPGDVVVAMNGKTIQVDNTDAEGRLILADALCYAQQFNPRFILDIATLTGAMRVALGGEATGVFSNSTDLWKQLQTAGSVTGDRVWRFPLWKAYTKRVTDSPAVDVNNVGKGKGGGSCTAAAFLREFVPKGDWLHLDIAGVMGPSDDSPYLNKGMTGRPTRTLIQFLSQLSKK